MLSHKKSLNILKETNALVRGSFYSIFWSSFTKYIQCAKLLSNPNKG